MSQPAVSGSIRHINEPDAALDPWPIPEGWVQAGSPRASGAVLWQSDDKRIMSGVWQCTPGKFVWEYTWDETAHISRGRFTVTDQDGHTVSLGAGDLLFIEAGTRAVWEVAETVRKAFHVRSDTAIEL